MNYRLLLAALSLGLAALPAAFANEAAPEVAQATPDPTPKLALGVMMKQGDKLVFSPCRDRSYALVEDVSSDGAVLQGLRAVGLDAGKKLYVELIGVMDGINLKVSTLNLARTEGRCQQPGGEAESWRAAGYAPGWLLVAGGEHVTLRREGVADLNLPYREFQTDTDGVSYQGRNDNHQLSLTFTATQCLDPQAQAVFGWQARLSVDGQTLTGCAWRR